MEAVITDPPYCKKCKQTYSDGYDCSARVLRPHGDLPMIMAHYWLDPFDQMTLKHDDMRYRWTLAMNQSSGGFRRLPNGHHHLAVTYKPIGWWYKFGRRPNDRAGVVDSYQNPPPSKGHKWEQSPAWASFCIDHLYFTQGIIVDPMVGSGMLAVEALKRDYRAIVGDAEAAAVETTIEKVGKSFAEIRGQFGGRCAG